MIVSVMSEEDVKKIASLVRLELSQEEITRFSKIIPQTLGTVEVLKKLNTDGVQPTSSVTGLTNVYQQELNTNTLSKEEALANAREVVNGLFAAPSVLLK